MMKQKIQEDPQEYLGIPHVDLNFPYTYLLYFLI